MNTELLKKRCGIDIADANKRSMRFEAMKLTDTQLSRLKENTPKGINHLLITKIEAYRLMQKRQWTGIIKVIWWQTPTIGVNAFCNEELFRTLAG